MRLWLLILLLANFVLAGFVYMSEARAPVRAGATDWNADKLRLLPVLPDKPAPNAAADDAAKSAQAACVEWASISVDDFPRARTLVAALALPAGRLVERRIEGPTQFWVFIPPGANPAATVARLKEAGLTDVALQPDNAVSLGLYNSEDGAMRALGQVQVKGVGEARIGPRSLRLKGMALMVREASPEVVSKLGEFKDQFAGSTVHPVACPPAS